MNKTFEDLVKREFAFLESGGFQRHNIAPSMIEYVSSRSHLLIVWDRRLGELDAVVGLNHDRRETFHDYSLCDVMMAVDQNLIDVAPRQVYDEALLEKFVAELAGRVRRYASRALEGDVEFFDLVESHRKRCAELLTREWTLQPIREMAEQAWRNRDFAKVCHVLTSIEDHLTRVERARLIYARHRTPVE